jgi:riboflavin kinase/FMN adenylyltransferase
LIEQSHRVGGPAVVLTFDPHPLELLAPERFMPVLTTVSERARLLRLFGVNEVLFLQTNRELLQLSAAEFFDRIICDGFQARAVVEGFNFHFGRDRAGDTDYLAKMCAAKSIAFTLVPPLTNDGIPVSSSRVRHALAEGDISSATKLLGRFHRIHGIVASGRSRGRTLGFPTANIENVPVVTPGDGVYAVYAVFDGNRYDGVANVGTNPTFGETSRRIEIHILDWTGDLYGREIQVDFVGWLRGVTKFAGATELIAQIQDDIAAALRVFAEVSDGR